MTDNEKVTLLQAMTGETDAAVLSAYLTLAGKKVCAKAYPFATEAMTVPEQYEHVQLQVAVYMLNKRGGEGEVTHNENGISRSYEDGDVPPSLLREITPLASVL